MNTSKRFFFITFALLAVVLFYGFTSVTLNLIRKNQAEVDRLTKVIQDAGLLDKELDKSSYVLGWGVDIPKQDGSVDIEKTFLLHQILHEKDVFYHDSELDKYIKVREDNVDSLERAMERYVNSLD